MSDLCSNRLFSTRLLSAVYLLYNPSVLGFIWTCCYLLHTFPCQKEKNINSWLVLGEDVCFCAQRQSSFHFEVVLLPCLLLRWNLFLQFSITLNKTTLFSYQNKDDLLFFLLRRPQLRYDARCFCHACSSIKQLL